MVPKCSSFFINVGGEDEERRRDRDGVEFRFPLNCTSIFFSPLLGSEKLSKLDQTDRGMQKGAGGSVYLNAKPRVVGEERQAEETLLPRKEAALLLRNTREEKRGR